MGSNRIQGSLNQRGLVHEHPIVQHGGVYRHEEYGKFGPGTDTVSQFSLKSSTSPANIENVQPAAGLTCSPRIDVTMYCGYQPPRGQDKIQRWKAEVRD